MKPLAAIALALVATLPAHAQSIQSHKQTEKIPLPVPAKPESAARPAALTATQLFNKASPSVVVVEATDADGKTLATGSGVVVAHLPNDRFTVATNCHVVEMPGSDGLPFVAHGKNYGASFVTSRDATRDLCLLEASLLKRDTAGKPVSFNGSPVSLPAPPVAQVAPLRSLEVGERLYAIGAPQGLELSLSEGLVSGLRKDGGTTLIQTTAAISPGSSGGGLFDAQGRLVGITTKFLKDSQALNFAVPAELIANVPAVGNGSVRPAAHTPRQAPAPKLGPTSLGDRWQTFYIDDERALDIDTKTIGHAYSQEDPQANQTVAWIRTRYSSPRNDGDGSSYVVDVRQLNFWCNTSSYITNQIIQRDAEGKVIFSHEYSLSEAQVKSIVPDTFAEAMRDKACSL